MANRRMFSRAVTNSGRFLRLSVEARMLYFDLGMEADDDGFVEAFVRLRATETKEVHLRELADRGFITIEDEEELVVHICHWDTNNLIRKDRYTPSIYRGMYPHCVGEAPVEEAKPEPEAKPTQEQQEQAQQEPETIGTPDGCFLGDNRLTQDRIEKDRINKDSLSYHRLETEGSTGKGSARARAGDEGTPGERNPGENQMEFEKKRREAMDYLLNSKHFAKERDQRALGRPVDKAVEAMCRTCG